MAPSSDRNLLFGILALQMDFITREQLLAGMQAWVLAKEISLAEHLVQAGAFQLDDRQLIEPLVEAHIRRHADSPEQSLASLRSLDSLRGELASLQDQELEASIAHIPSSAASPAEADPYATLAGGSASSQTVRFRILRPHAEGGLGRVFVAYDNELSREVALKEIKPDRSDDAESRGRFIREAEVTGSLEHPGIVPVYGLGAYPDGRPFYAMRFVRGKSLKEGIAKFHHRFGRGQAAGEGKQPSGGSSGSGSEYADSSFPGRKLTATDENLELRKLLQRLIAVCEAMDYAHSRGVLHRDLKPGNIMLGKYGETLIVDWGLAKPLGQVPTAVAKKRPVNTTLSTFYLPEPALESSISEGQSTLLGSTLGTPSFMSPEQAQGRLDLLGPASDIFSLGAILYEILTGQPPYAGGTREELLRKAQTAEYAPPRTLCRGVPPPLEAICLKALAPLPANRYPSCEALAQDIERFLADEPITALAETSSQRLFRYARRNLTWVHVAMITFVIVALAFIGMLLLFVRLGAPPLATYQVKPVAIARP
ncbi:MAG: serine/threonine-protein kinase [Pirellulaceae bacterium]